jgi:hypothetical protein
VCGVWAFGEGWVLGGLIGGVRRRMDGYGYDGVGNGDMDWEGR